MNYKLLSGLIFFLMLFTAFSCAPKKPAIERSHYILETSRDRPLHGKSIPASLSVRDFSVSPGYQGVEIIYKTGQNTVRADFYNHYFILPGPMISRLARSWITDSGLFASVIPMSSHKEADYILEGAVSSIYGDLRDPKNPAAVVEINFLLLKNTGHDYEVAFQKQYRSETEMEGPGAQYLIPALNSTLEKIFTSLEEDMVGGLTGDLI